MDLIKKEDAIKVIKNLWYKEQSIDDEIVYETNEYAKGLLDAIDAVNDLFSIEVLN